MRAIDNLENKNSSGHDEISDKILKYNKYEISNSLTLINNQMMTTGIFPDALKKTKMTPIFKKRRIIIVNKLSAYLTITNDIKDFRTNIPYSNV